MLNTGAYCNDDELELVEEPQENTNYLNEPQFPVNTPDPLKLLKLKNKKLQSRVYYLEGQVKVYEEFFKKYKEEK